MAVSKGTLKEGTRLRSSICEYEVVRLLGAGGQGEVYSVTCNGKTSALKWYFKSFATHEQKEILRELIRKGIPTGSFLWPEDLVEDGERFGYIMPLRGKEYSSLQDLMRRSVNLSFSSLCRAAFQLVKGFDALHSSGFVYRDISFGNVFLDAVKGRVLICDNDNVAPKNKDSSVLGTPKFMAPEIVRGEAQPSRHTDLYSLAILLFYLFFMHHPLDGKRESDIHILDITAMNLLYGTQPLFIYDPNNASNRPVPGYQDNAIIFWQLYPESFRSMFTKAFTVGLSEPTKRVMENEWLRAISKLGARIFPCPYCKSSVFMSDEAAKEIEALGEEVKAGKTVTPKAIDAGVCWRCRKRLPCPRSITFKSGIRVMTFAATKGASLYEAFLEGRGDYETPIGEIVTHPKNPRVLGLRNLGQENWTYHKPSGEVVQVEPMRSAPVLPGASIEIGSFTGIFM